MESVLNLTAHVYIVLFGLCALVMLAVGLSLIVNRKARQRRLAALRARLNELEPSDPEYNQVRAIYTAMTIDGHRWDLSHTSNSDDGSHSAGASESGSGGD